MTKREWLAATDPKPMLKRVQRNGSDRKLRLFLVASARLVWDLLADPEMRGAVETSEQYADGLVSAEQVRAFRDRLDGHLRGDSTRERMFWARSGETYPIYNMARIATYPDRMLHTLSTYVGWTIGIERYHRLLPPLIRDIFGNPFRRATADPSWLTSDVVALARGMYESRDFSAMPILADALQDAGCGNKDVLGHCRGDGPHVRGCWVVDLVTREGVDRGYPG